MPVRNSQNTLPIAIQSILAQTHTDWELILVDDGSTDDTLRIAKQFSDPRIKVHADGEWRGLPKRLNQIIDSCRGAYFARMDADDVAYPERLRIQLDYLGTHQEIDLVGTQVLVFGRFGAPLGMRLLPETHEAICRKPIVGFPMAHPTFMGRLEWFRRFRYYEGSFGTSDQNLLMRSHKSSRFANIRRILLGYREEKVDLRKILKYRRSLFLSVLQEFGCQKRFDLVMLALIYQILKASLDCLAVSTGLNYRILRHRARAINEVERTEWMQVWSMLCRGMSA